MIVHSRIANIGIPAVIGTCLAWLAMSFYKNESNLNKRRIELEKELANNTNN
tara:strand:- start:360 stop:515 length:156 start_codon:yes stop_codon:yes gene_type:complete